MKNLFRKINQKISVRTLRTDILTIFLTLTVVTFCCVILYSYYRNYTSIEDYSKKTMRRVSATIIEKFRNIGNEVESSLNDSAGILLTSKDITTINDPDLISFMVAVTDFNPEISAFALAFPGSEIIQVNDVALSTQTHLMTDQNKPVPANARFVIKKIYESPKPSHEIWTYVDKDYKPILSETLPYLTIDRNTRPWYVGALANKGIYWTAVYRLSGTHELGIGAGKAVYNSEGKLLGVLGTNLSFISLSNFINSQKISRSGKVVIVDNQGSIVLPNPEGLSKNTLQLVTKAWQKSKKNHHENFMFEYDSDNYLVFLSQIPGHFGKDWSILVIAPFLDFFGNLISIQIEIVLITLAILMGAIVVIAYSAKRISNPIVELSKEIDKITNLDLGSRKRIRSHIIEINMMDTSLAAMRTAVRSFARYVPREIVRKLLHKHKDIALRVEKKTLTILFTDIKDFTTIVENNPLDDVIRILSDYFDGLSKIILQNKGTIDKYIGDSIMAFWGAPTDDPEHAHDACLTALLCSHFLKDFNRRRQENSEPGFYTRFGVNTGEVLVGNIGTRERMNYTAVGDPVNVASRLESIAKVYQVEIIVSDQIYEKIKERFLCRPLDKIMVKGKHHETEIYQLMAILEAGRDISANLVDIKLCERFTRAYQLFKTGDLIGAKNLFQEIQHEFPQDYPTQLYLERIATNDAKL